MTVFNDACAAGLLAAVARGRCHVPGDLSVVGYDDSRVARLPGIALTTIAQDAPALAGAAARSRPGAGGGAGRPSEEVVVAPHVVVRGRPTGSP